MHVHVRVAVLLLSVFSAATALAIEPTFKPDDDGFIRDWVVLGPVLYDPLGPVGTKEIDGKQISNESALRPSAGDKVKLLDAALTWTPVTSKKEFLDFHEYSKATDSLGMMGYAVVYVVADQDFKDVQLKIGASDHLRAYLNGSLVAYWHSMRDFAADQLETVVSLKKGVNPLVLKVINAEGGWEVGARFTDAANRPITTLKVTSDRKAAESGAGLSSTDDKGFIHDWLVAAPAQIKFLPFATGQVDKKQFPNEATMQPRPTEMIWYHGREVTWNRHSSTKYFVDFGRFADGFKDLMGSHLYKDGTIFNGLSYAVAYIEAPSDLKDLTLKMGVNDHGKVYLNGKEVVKWDGKPGTLEKDKVAAKVSLKKGHNLLVFKAVNAANNWQGCVRFVDKAGNPVRDYVIRQAPPVTLPAR